VDGFDDVMKGLGRKLMGPSPEERRATYLTKLVGAVLTRLVTKGVLTATEARELVADAKKAADA
jgi:polyhydroxyalkanoate synthesis regulator phasin